MPQLNDLSRSLVALDQDSTIIAVVELSQSSWLVAGVLPGIERQPQKKLEPSAERLLGPLHRWRDEAVRAGKKMPNGDVLVAEQSAGYLTLLRDDGEGRAKWIDRHVEDLNRPYGLALRGDEILVADQDAIWRVPHVVGALRAGRPVPPQKADDVPPDQRKPVPGAYGAELLTKKGVFGITVGHQNRHLAIDPKNGGLYVGVGSSGNLGVEPEPKATIQRFDADGSNQTTVASGTRNPTALAFHPQTGELWAVVQERDGLGDNLPSDYLIRVQQGGFYGWPYAYIGKHPQPGHRLPPCRQRGNRCG
jgi:glucose/arabinose dehydrogenase